jgi:hypothetical protein
MSKLPLWSAADTAYIAGLIDGEGCIGIYHRKDRGYFVQLTIVNTNSELMSWLEWKLHANTIKSLPDKRPRNKQSFAVTIDRMRAFEVLQRVNRYIIAKSQQIQLALQFKQWQNARKTDKNGSGHRTYSDQERQICLNFVEQSRVLNRKGRER